MDGSDIAAELRRTLRLLVAATVVLYLIVAVAVVFVYRDANAKRDELAIQAAAQKRQAAESTAALARQAAELARQAADTKRQVAKLTAAQCSLRGDLEQRVTASQRFLAEHPAGIPGLPAATIQQTIAGQLRTIKSLSGLKCVS